MFGLVSASINGITQLSNDLVLLLFLALFVVATVFVAAWFISININRPSRLLIGKMKVSGVLTIIVIAGILIRFGFTFAINGYLGMYPVSQWNDGNTGGLSELFGACYEILSGGFKRFNLATDFPSVNYPVPVYLSLFFAGIADLFGAFSNTTITFAMQILMRMPMILCDAASAVVLYKIAKKYCNSQVGLVIAALYMFCPVFFFSSGIWGSTFSILALPILLSLYFMTEKNFLGLTISYSFALLTSRDAMFLAPIFIVFVAYYFIKSVKANKKAEERLRFNALFKDKVRGLAIRLPIYFACSLVGMYLISLPFLYDVDYSFFKFFNQIFILPFTTMTYISFNSLGIYNMFGRNNSEIGFVIPQWAFSLTFFVISAALVIIIYISRKNRAVMSLIAPFIVFTMGIFFMGFSELNLIVVLGMLLISFLLIKDKRILHVFGIVALTVVLNASTVMMTSGYFSNSDYPAYALNYTGTAALSTSVFGSAMSSICSGFTMLAFVYLTLIVLDVTLSGSIKQFNAKKTDFFSATKDWLTFKQK